MQNPARKTASAASTQIGHVTAPRGARSRQPIHKQRASSQTSGGYASDADAKTCPRLKNQSETENPSSISRSTLRSASGRRQSTSPKRKTAQKPSQTP